MLELKMYTNLIESPVRSTGYTLKLPPDIRERAEKASDSRFMGGYNYTSRPS